MSKFINNAALSKALKKRKNLIYVARKNYWDGQDYLFYATDCFILGVPFSGVDELGDYPKSLLLTPDGNRLKPGECLRIRYDLNAPQLIEHDPIDGMLNRLTQTKEGQDVYATPYFIEDPFGTFAIYGAVGTPVVLDKAYLDILPLTSSGGVSLKGDLVFFRGEVGIVLYISPLDLKRNRAQDTEISALVREINKNKNKESA